MYNPSPRDGKSREVYTRKARTTDSPHTGTAQIGDTTTTTTTTTQAI